MTRRLRNLSNKQNIRLWYNYLQVALDNNLKINSAFYKKWDLKNIKSGEKFDKWWVDHSRLFNQTKYLTIRIPSSTPVDIAIKNTKRIISQRLKPSEFNITSKRFRYLEIDDYLKCFKRRKSGKNHLEVILGLNEDYLIKEEKYKKSKRLLKRQLLKDYDAMKVNAKNIISISIRKIKKAEKIIANVANGNFPGRY